ncbi:probable E3 ubiquitin-protein ligase TRIML1 isoform X2 [Talpa occidentalis]|uniref:probable E3 ubiquitin-protein ligase TRIML1 isoform X2 n=1 Tax=Talpa occidentalis TaxID=50954 RepID=UPI00188F6DBF|nr:probable E3 ubiquitin-protein ligase TRIML1 isoform X2 [Talpa occidentalis]
MSFFEKTSTADLMENLREELTCFICLDYFTNPVTTECGHNFCLVCLLKSWEEHNTPLSCPECWRTLETPHFQPNERLGRLAGIGKQLRRQVLQSEGELRRMLATVKLLSDDEKSVKAFSTQDHGGNRVYLSSEAGEHHKEKLQETLNLLRKKKKETQVILNHEKERVILCTDVRGTLERSEPLLLQCPEATITRLSLCRITGMREMLRKFSTDISLDPATANAYLVLSEDLRSVRHGGIQQQLPDNPERFDQSATVLGAQTFTCGRHYWEVDVGNKTEWEVGICKDSLSRKGNLPKPPGALFSLIGLKIGDDYSLWISSPLKGQHVREPVHKVGVFLDYESGHIAFYNVTEESLIYSFPPTSFQEALRPIFSPCLPNEGTNTGPLTICSLNSLA